MAFLIEVHTFCKKKTRDHNEVYKTVFFSEWVHQIFVRNGPIYQYSVRTYAACLVNMYQNPQIWPQMPEKQHFHGIWLPLGASVERIL